MPIDRQAVDHVARLARLDLSDEERERMQAELTQILEHVEKIQTLDLDPVQPTSQALDLSNVMRPDVAGPCLTQAEALANAPDQEDGRFRVPRILEET
ncbi:MAG TPA: Asp-tRNA(Asn)/Glu-tRNA(Gln) amidotransferase subunit GatC [Actinomycetota bacterium]|nr:Asp-tRNA(Asn)/Glu-tRNA(Gln) amidotransferase subunit GatC [Actinomycetota bacterium]